MVGKGVETKSSRIFHQCYLKCCKLQNLTPLNNVIALENGKRLDFCVDRIKYVEWPPILNALSCDLSLHSVCIRCRQQVKTVLEQIDCERLAKTVNKRAVILTNFMLTNLVEAICQLLSSTTLLATLLFEGLPLKIPYLSSFNEALVANSSLQHLFLGRCLIGDAGCLALCKTVRGLPNILTLDLSGCELTPLGAGYIADLLLYQKIHRYSENWVHTLRYRLPDLDTMAGLRRVTLCANTQLGDEGAGKLLDVLADDLWMKALDIQNCGLTEKASMAALHMMQSNTTLVVLDLRHNPEVSMESLSKIRAAVRDNERGLDPQFSWLGNVSGCSSNVRVAKLAPMKNGVINDRVASNTRVGVVKHLNKTNAVKKERDLVEVLKDQLQEEISHRQQLEELNQQLVDQMKQLKHQQIRLWAKSAESSGSEQSSQESSGDLSCSSGSSSSVPIDQHTLSYIQQAFKDIYSFIKNNQCNGHKPTSNEKSDIVEEVIEPAHRDDDDEFEKIRVNIVAKKAQSTHVKLMDNVKMKKTTKSAHLLGKSKKNDAGVSKPEMIERHMGDTATNSYIEQVGDMLIQEKAKNQNSIFDKSSTSSGGVSDSSDTLVCSPAATQRSLVPNPREALYSSSDDDSS